MLEIKKLKDCTNEEGVQAWNKGFEGYFFDMTTTADAFEKRMEQEGLDEELSVVAFEDGEPVGLVLNGIRESHEARIAWNGGTGIAPGLRGKGVGVKLMKETLAILEQRHVDTATLEAISGNEKAIALYRKLGYEIVDELHFLQLKGLVDENNLPASAGNYELQRTTPEKAGELTFYRNDFPWQTLWQSAKDGEALIARDQDGAPVGYAYFRKVKDNPDRIVLLQCEADPAAPNRKEIIEVLLMEVFERFTGQETRTAVNVPVKENSLTHQALLNIGFEITVKQVFMKKEM